MSEEILQSSALSRQLLKSVLDAAYMKCSLDKDGDVLIEDKYRFFAFPSVERETIRFVAFFRSNSGSSLVQRHVYANKVANELVGIRVCVDDDGDFRFDYTMLTDGGVTKRQIVMTAKRFATLLQLALQEDKEKVLG